jgi:catechol-2,3-dioxygenase
MLKRIDHIYLSVFNFSQSEAFYDLVMRELGQRKGDKVIAGEPHAHYFGSQFQVTIRPAKSAQKHDSYAPGLHHLCFQVETRAEVDLCYKKL